MTTKPTQIPDVIHLFPDVYPDERGEFLESYNKQTLVGFGITADFIQDNVSVNKKGALRGLHYQKDPFAQGKLVSVISGTVFDVAVDIRKGSPTYGKWASALLTDREHNMLFIPPGFAHGFYVLSEEARFFYKVSGNYYNKAANAGILWNDPALGIDWPLTSPQPIMSVQDRALPPLASLV